MRHCFFLVVLFFSCYAFSQKSKGKEYFVDANYFYGNILPHNNTIKHLITTHPEGILLSVNRKTYGDEAWQSEYNFPDYGLSFQYQGNKNETLGDLYGLYGHYNFYFLKRNLQFRVGQGVAYSTNPYDKESNFRNFAYSTRLMPSTYFMINYNKQRIWKGLGVQTGLLLVHHSNANIKAPNTSTNTMAFTVGLNYNFSEKEPEYTFEKDTTRYAEPLRYTVAFRSGVNESDVIGSGQYPFYVLSGYVDKRISKKSAIQFGGDFFWSLYLKEYIRYMAIAYYEKNSDPNVDYKRAGIFIGHELFVNRFTFETQLGYYVYDPAKISASFYQRLGLKFYVTRNVFGGISLKTHAAKAEALECSLGIRL
ncbi:acyloxyacyl hydrolase [Flavobacterium sp. CAU 1735]|uniref:acyloxyacyl hydrolase n=1 Tax=Flavobacterium sp. CAU 1735 TaxID=3140361 RepID=UPI003261B0D2